jgi:hypothetical protein
MISAKQHLEDSEMTYWAHLRHSLANSGRLAWLALASLVHAFIPQVWPQTAAQGVIRIYNRMRQYRHLRRLQQTLRDS